MGWFRRRKPQHSPREGWVVLVDKDGREVSERIPVVVDGDPLTFNVEHGLTFQDFEQTTISAVRVIDADGVARDVPIG